MTESGQLKSSAVRALLEEGTLAGSWTLDLAKTEIRLRTRHAWGLAAVHGVFRQVEGTGTVSATGDVTGTLTVLAGSIDTRHARRDAHLRGANFLDVTTYPRITFAVAKVSAVDGGVRITGSLTVHGHTRPISFDAKAVSVDGEVWLHAEVPVNRADYGITGTLMGAASLKNTIIVHAVFTRQ